MVARNLKKNWETIHLLCSFILYSTICPHDWSFSVYLAFPMVREFKLLMLASEKWHKI
jgi:hypothetical protein